jgi:hypothetical protein
MFFTLAGAMFPTTTRADSQWVRTGATGRLIYVPDAGGDRIMDFSGVGYRGQGTRLIPNDVANAVTVSPIAGDDTASIQSAIDYVSSLAPNSAGFRGAVLLEAGHYDINTQLVIAASGVVLRGVGRDSDDTVLHGRGTEQRPLIRVLGSGSQSLTGSTRTMIDKVVPVGATSFRVNSVADFNVGDTVRVERPSPANWIEDLGMDEFGWAAGSFNIRYDRTITRIEGDRIFLDAPLANSFEQQYGGGTVRKYTWADRIENVGIESLRAESDFASLTDENHAWEFVSIENAQNVWVRHTTSQYFGDSAVVSNPTAKWVTVDDAINLDPRSLVTGGRRYTFDLSGQLELVTNSQAHSGRHDFVNNSTRPPGPHVFHDSVANDALDDAGPHQRWATGSLFDNIVVNGDQLNARNRGDLGTGHGWSGANIVIWNSTASGGFIVQSPPTAQNWLIGSTGPQLTDTTYGPHLPAYVDSHGAPVTVGGSNSLYEAQMNDSANVRQFHWAGGDANWTDDLAWNERVAPGVYEVSIRDYLIGDIDDFTDDNNSVDNPFIDPAWQAAIQGGSALPLTGFDDANADRNVAFTIQHELAADERVVHGYLGLSLQQTGGTVSTDFVRLFDMDPAHRFDFADLGWDAEVNSATPYVGVLDLGTHLEELQSGAVNVQINDDTAVDWALYVVTVAKPTASAVGPSVYLDGGGTTVVDSPVAPLAALQIGGVGSGRLQLEDDGSLVIQNSFEQATNGELHVFVNESMLGDVLLDVAEVAELAGVLTVELAPGYVAAPGDTFQILQAAGGIVNEFDDLLLGELPMGLAWSFSADETSISVEIVSAVLSGDFNGDGVVDASDYSVWRNNLGSPTEASINHAGNGIDGVDAGDYLVWKQHYGDIFGPGAGGLFVTVPEPSGLGIGITVLGVALMAFRRQIVGKQFHNRGLAPRG